MTSQVELIVEKFLTKRVEELGLSAPLTPSTAVLDAGLLDSLALVDLITEIEKTTGLEADILLFDPSEITTVEDLIHQLKQVFAS